MDIRKAVGWAKGHRTGVAVAALILVFAGVDLLLNVPKNRAEQLFAVPLLAAGFLLLALILWPSEKPGPQAPNDTLARRLLNRVTWQGRLVPLFPLFGIAVIVADLTYNRLVSTTPALLENDVVAILLGVALVAYRFVPARFERERDFVLLFLAVLSTILIVPLLIARSLGMDAVRSVNAYSAFALAPQTSALLNMLGVPNTILLDVTGAPGLRFETLSAQTVEVYITTACSGVYSFAIFASAFSAFVLTEQRRFTPRVALFFALGVFFAYAANVLRMVVIVLVGYHFSGSGNAGDAIQTMLAAHSNAGWIIFLAWIALFWALLFRFLPREAPAAAAPEAAQLPRKRGTYCGICGIVLTPAIPATRCACGRFYHKECLAVEGRCPNCQAPSLPYAAVDNPAT
jgi:archaeosortase C (PEF-CTERM variant)